MKEKTKKILKSKTFLFVFAFLLIFLTILPEKDLYGGSGDAMETWKVASTFFSKKHFYSYVMYKGIYAFIPSVISYYIGNFFHFDKFLILKIINALSFAYITVIGIPYLVKNLLNVEDIKTYKYYLFIILFYILENSVFCFISVDYLSAVFFILLCNRIVKYNKEKSKKNLILLGILIGFNLSLSGQFSLGAYLILLYVILNIIYSNKNNKIIDLKKIVLSVFMLIVGMLITMVPNKLYNKVVVDHGRKLGNTIATGSDWVKVGMTRDMMGINYPEQLPDNIGLSIMNKRSDDIESAKKGANLYTYKQYIKIILRYPLEFGVRVFERIFLGVTNDHKNMFSPILRSGSIKFNLLVMLTFIYICLVKIKSNVKKVKDLFTYKTIIVISSLLTVIPPSLMHVENRYYIYLRTLIMAYAIFSFNFKFKKLGKLKDLNINYNVVTYVIFMILCVSLYLAIYQSSSYIALFE